MTEAELILEAKQWLARGVWDTTHLFNLMARPSRRVHYSRIRNAIHKAKTL